MRARGRQEHNAAFVKKGLADARGRTRSQRCACETAAGGPTNFGITIADYRQYVKPGATAADVRAMRADEAKAIYRAHYWNAMRCDELPAGLDYALFDFGVNSGIGRAVKYLQRLLGLAADGRITDAIIAAASRRDAADLIARLCDERLAFLKHLKTWPVFGAGWGRRVAEVRAAALTMARSPSQTTGPGSPAPTPAPAAPAAPPPNIPLHHITAGGIVAAGATAAHQSFQTGARPVVVIAIATGSLVLAIAGWLAWRRWRKTQLRG
jgi:lysozyme family protein